MSSLFAGYVNGKSVGHFMADEGTAPGVALARAQVMGWGNETGKDGLPSPVHVKIMPAQLMGRRLALYTRRK